MLNRLNSLWLRFRTPVLFIFFGIALQLFRTTLHISFEKYTAPSLANWFSIIISLFISFNIHYRITWKFRPGTVRQKALRFVQSEGVLGLIRGVIFPSLVSIPLIGAFMECPLVDFGKTILRLITALPFGSGYSNTLTSLFENQPTCTTMQTIVIDGVAAVASFLLHNYWSFKARSKSTLARV